MPNWKLALRQGRAHKRPLLAVGAVILAAITVLAATPLYFAILTDLGLRHALTPAHPSAYHIQVVVPLTPLEPEENARTRRTMEALAEDTVGWLTAESRVYTETRQYLISVPGQPLLPRNQAPRGFLQSLGQVENHLRVLEGELPQPGVSMVDGVLQVDVLVGAQGAQVHGTAPGETLLLNQGTGEDRRRLRIRISGIVAATDPSEDYWLGYAETFLGSVVVAEEDIETGDEVPATGFLVSEQSLLEATTAAFPGQPGSSLTFLYTDLERVNAASIDRVQESLKRLAVDLTNSLPRAMQLTQLDSALARLTQRLFFARIPLLVVILMLELVVLYALGMVVNLLIDAQRQGLALMASRGASPRQVLTVYGAQGGLLAGVGLVVGPPVAALSVAALGLTPPFAAFTGGAFLPLKLLPSAYLWGLGGAALCMALLLGAALRGLRLGAVREKLQRGRQPGLPLVQRYYLDMGLALVAGLFLWNLTQKESLVTRGGLGTLSEDQVLLLTPVLFLGSVVLLLLRFLPLFLRLLGRIGGRVLPPWAALGLWQMGRRPAFYNQLLLLVVLAVALGWFGATFGATLERSVRERALYRTPVDFAIRPSGSFPIREVDDLESYFSRVPGIRSVSTAYEGKVSIGASSVEYPLLAVDPRNASSLFWFREDFADGTFTDLMVALGGATETDLQERRVSADAETLGLWVKPDAPYTNLFLWVVFRDATGSYVRTTFGELDFAEWRYLEVSLRSSSGTLRFVPPATLEGIHLYEPTFRQGTPGRVHIDGMQITTTSSQMPVVLEGFESLIGWHPVATSPLYRDELKSDTREAKEGRSSIAFRFGRDTVGGIRGFFLNPINGPLPILASPELLATAGAQPGDEITLMVQNVLVPAVAREEVRYFPPLDPRAFFVIAPIDPLLDYLNFVKGRTPNRPNQILLDLPDEPAQREAAMALLAERGLLQGSSITDRQRIQAELEVDPLMMVGWRGLVFAAFVVLVLMIALGYLAYSFLVARDRRLEIGVVRALGLKRGDVFRLVILEHALILGVGGLAGTWAGLQLSRLMIPLITFTEGGREILPPFIMETSWVAILILLAGLAVGVLATVLLVGILLARVSAAQALRTGEA